MLAPKPVSAVPQPAQAGDLAPEDIDPQAKAEEILAAARAEAEEIKRLAYQEGLAQGLEDAVARIEAECARIRQQAAAIIRQAEEVRRETLSALEEEVVKLAQAIAEKVVMQELAANPELVVNIAREALALLRDRRTVVLFAHPEDARLLREKQGELATILPEGATLRIIEDPEMQRGGILADSGEGLVDARLDARWRAVLEALWGEGGKA